MGPKLYTTLNLSLGVGSSISTYRVLGAYRRLIPILAALSVYEVTHLGQALAHSATRLVAGLLQVIPGIECLGQERFRLLDGILLKLKTFEMQAALKARVILEQPE